VTLPVAILAGGLATRLGSIAAETPKVLVDVCGKPFIVHQLELLRSNGLTEAVLCVGHLGKLVEDELGDGTKFGVRLRYSFDGPNLLGTGGALRNALPLLGSAFFVLYGDSYLRCDYNAVERSFRSSGKPGLMTVLHNDDRWDRSNVAFRDGKILAYDKASGARDMHYIDYGLGILDRAAFDSYDRTVKLDLERIYQDLLRKNQLAAFEVSQRFYEVGSPAGLSELRDHLCGASPASNRSTSSAL
jgi:NDP-sugar pyrophosphorylase family protein